MSRSVSPLRPVRPGVAAPVAGAADMLLRSGLLQMREFFGRPLAVVVAIVQPAAFVLLVLLVAPGESPEVQVNRVAGVALLAVWATSVWSAGMMLTQDRGEGTLSMVLLRAKRPFVVLLGRSLGSAVAGVLAILVTIVVALGLLGELGSRAALTLLLLLIPAVLSSAAVGTLVATLFIRSRSAPRIAEVLLYPVFVGSGALLPLDLFPAWAQAPARALPLYWANQVLRAGSEGRFALAAGLVLVLLSVGYTLLGAWIFNRVLASSRKRGDLDLV